MYRLIGLLILIAVVYAVINIIQSSADTGTKVVWVVVVLLLSPVGVILWWFLGPRTRTA